MNPLHTIDKAAPRVTLRDPIPTRPAAYGLPSHYTEAQVEAAIRLRSVRVSGKRR